MITRRNLIMINTGVYIVENPTGEYQPRFWEKYLKKGRGQGGKMLEKEEERKKGKKKEKMEVKGLNKCKKGT
jgi:hypothetical protein